MPKKHITFFGKIFGSLWDVIKKPFENANHTFLEIAIKITNTVKDALNAGVIDLITAIIPTDIDNKLVDLLRKKLPILLADELLLQMAGTLSTEEEAQAMAKQILDSFGDLPDEKKEEFYTSLAAKIYIFLQAHKGKKITFGEAAAFVETAYRAWKASQEK